MKITVITIVQLFTVFSLLCLPLFSPQAANANQPGTGQATKHQMPQQPTTQMDVTVVQGVKTAGTVRVNNLANLEAVLNIIANGGEIGGILWGRHLIWGALMKAPLKRWSRAGLGTSVVAFSMMLPGVINWIVASARDASLCN